MGMRRCAWTRCPQLVRQGERYCEEHRHAYERQRGSSGRRGYDTRHQRQRAQWAYRIRYGDTVWCTRCGKPITIDDAWDLGHSDDRRSWTGPEHAHCNRKAGQANSVRMRERWN